MYRASTQPWTRRALIAVACGAIALYYLWVARAATSGYNWGRDSGGYYNLLGRAFAGGHLYVPITPKSELLRQQNPWDPAVDDALKMHDMALYNGRYYLYHGAAPAVLLFTPWRLITGRDLPENFALFLLCCGGFAFSVATVLRVVRDAGVDPDPWLLLAILLALGLCTDIPFLLSRTWVYEIAIACGYFCLAAGMYFLARGGVYSPAVSGVFFAAAVASRPHLILCGIVALAWLGWRAAMQGCKPRRNLLAFLTSYAGLGALLALYNYLRFDNPVEFGLRYLLTGAFQNRVDLHPHNWPIGFYFTLLAPPHFSPVFPWVRMLLRYPYDSAANSFPEHYFIEPTIGAFWLAPFVIAAVAARGVLRVAALGSLAVLGFLLTSHMSTQRYEVDFLPLAVMAAAGTAGIAIARRSGLVRIALTVVLTACVAFGAIVNLALSISGPYEELRKNRPLRYLRIAQRLSPFAPARPMLNPRVEVELTADVSKLAEGVREPLLSVAHNQYQLFVERTAGGLHLISQSESSTLTAERPGTAPLHVAITYSPETGKLVAVLDGRETFTHDIAMLIAASADIRPGEAWADANSARRFSGQLQVTRRSVDAR